MPQVPGRNRKSKGSDLVAASSLPAWVARALADAGIRKLSQLSGMKDDDLLKLRGVGPRSIEMIRAALKQARKKAKPTTIRQ